MSSSPLRPYPGGCEAIRQSLIERGVPEAAMKIVMASFATNTLNQYNSSLKAWWLFCQNNNINFSQATISDVILFLTERFNCGSGYSSLNTHRSALSIILGKDVVTNDCVNRFLKGAYKIKPPNPKYNITWDPSIVLVYLANYFPYDKITLHDLAHKCITLLAIASAQRMQTLSLIKINNISIRDNILEIRVPDIIKTSRPGAFQPLIRLPFIRENEKICPALAIQCYIDKTKTVRSPSSDDHLFISARKPFNKVGPQTLAHWVKKVLHKSGIDVGVFGAHSTRHASTSAAHRSGVSLEVIRKAAGWSDTSNIFLKYYKRDCIANPDDFVSNIFDVSLE